MLKHILENVRTKAPIIHNITNYVTVNDCANILLACGASPVMSDDIAEAAEITSICQALNINIGTLNAETRKAMFAAGKKANSCNLPIVLDPVAAGASKIRTETARALLQRVKFTAVKGNISEVKAIAMGTNTTKGVDADLADAITDNNLDKAIVFAKDLASKTGAVIAITGAIDLAADAERVYIMRNGHPMMSRVTGTGCMLSAITAAYLAANPERPLDAVAAAVMAMGLCGERAHARLSKCDGNATYRNYMIDEMYHLDGDTLESGAKYEIR